MISKSDYLLFKQCTKSFWLKKHRPELFENDKEKEKMDKGDDVTKIARELFPGGVLIPYSTNLIEMVEETKEELEKGTKTIYEAAFLLDDVLVICDIVRKTNNGWEIYEVKSSGSVKNRHLDDASFQYYVVSNTLPVSDIFITHINSKYVREEQLNIHHLFSNVSVLDYAKEEIVHIEKSINQMREILTTETEVVCPIGNYCKKYGKDDFECPVKSYCWADVPEYSVFDISRIGKKAFELYEKGIVHIKDIPDDFKLSELQKFQVQSEKEPIQMIDKNKIHEFLSDFTYPISFLDFETYQEAIPKYVGIKPYEQIPFQYSLHVLSEERDIQHFEFLAKEGEDPRRTLAEKLVRDTPKTGSVVAYNMGFEKSVIKKLSELFPDLKEELLSVYDRILDLMIPFQKKWFYISQMKGKYSIKNVLPALFPNDEELNYKNLDIQNGSMAMETFAKLASMPQEERKMARKQLLAYCELDTYAMVKIYQYLAEL